jgi:hypothetical protein
MHALVDSGRWGWAEHCKRSKTQPSVRSVKETVRLSALGDR